jgi:hypothetical protein
LAVLRQLLAEEVMKNTADTEQPKDPRFDLDNFGENSDDDQ